MVVLFDVDGTLVDTGGSGARSWRAAFEKLYGAYSTDQLESAGAEHVLRSLEDPFPGL